MASLLVIILHIIGIYINVSYLYFEYSNIKFKLSFVYHSYFNKNSKSSSSSSKASYDILENSLSNMNKIRLFPYRELTLIFNFTETICLTMIGVYSVNQFFIWSGIQNEETDETEKSFKHNDSNVDFINFYVLFFSAARTLSLSLSSMTYLIVREKYEDSRSSGNNNYNKANTTFSTNFNNSNNNTNSNGNTNTISNAGELELNSFSNNKLLNSLAQSTQRITKCNYSVLNIILQVIIFCFIYFFNLEIITMSYAGLVLEYLINIAKCYIQMYDYNENIKAKIIAELSSNENEDYTTVNNDLDSVYKKNLICNGMIVMFSIVLILVYFNKGNITDYNSSESSTNYLLNEYMLYTETVFFIMIFINWIIVIQGKISCTAAFSIKRKYFDLNFTNMNNSNFARAERNLNPIEMKYIDV